MSQTKKQSFTEASLNVGSGFIIAWIATIYLVPLMYQAFPFWEFWLTVVFTFISLARNYIWRRFFNGRM